MTLFHLLKHRFTSHYLSTIIGALSATCIYLAPIILTSSLPWSTIAIGALVFFIGAISKDPASTR